MGGRIRKNKSSLVTPLRPGYLVQLHSLYRRAELSQQNLVTAAKNQLRLLCGQPVALGLGQRRARPHALGHVRPEVRTGSQAPGSAAGNQRRNHFMALQIWKNKKISARKNVQFGDSRREEDAGGGRRGAARGPRGRQMPQSQVDRVWLVASSGSRVASPRCSGGECRERPTEPAEAGLQTSTCL